MIDAPPCSDGERAVWAAAYGAAYMILREFKRKHGVPEDDAAIAIQAADEAWGALHELRKLASGETPSDYERDARSVIKGDACG